jgi:sporulation protein YqfC
VQLLVENHRGMREFRPERVVVATTRGSLFVTGEALQVGGVDRESLVVTGKIRSLAFAGDARP